MKKLLVFSLLFLVGAALFNPVKAQVPTSGLQLHLKADAGTSSAVSGQKISQWNDQSGNGNHAVENNPVWQPTYINDGGISVVRFNPAAPTSMNLPTHAALGIQNSEYEFFLVSRTSSQSAAQFALAGGLNFGEIQISGTNGVRFIASTGNFLDNPARVDNGVFHIINSIATTSNSELGVDGVYVTKSENATHNINVGFNLGTRSDGFNRLDGDIAEILIYNRKLTTAESMQVTEYLKNKYSTPFSAYGAPQTPASNLNFASVTQNSMNVNLSKGSGTHRLVIARRGSAVNAAPSNGTAYTGNASFGSGSQIGSGNYVVYAGTEGTSTAISNLTFDETYHFAVYEYYLVNGVPQYSSAITGSRSTPNLTPISTIQTTSRTGTSISGTLTKGSGTHRLIVARASSPVSVGPTNGVPYTGNSAFGSGSQIGSGNYVIYAGTDGTSFNLSSLSGSTVYYLALYEYTLVNGQPRYAISQSPVFSDITYPNTSASAIQFSNVGLNEITISFTPGDGQKRIVVAREALAVSAGPSDNQTYTANTAFGSGQDLGSGNFVIYNGTGNSVTMTGLSNTTTYHFAVYEYTEFNGNTYYKTSAPAVSSQSTTVVPLPVIATDANFGSGTATSREITGAINPSGFETTVEVLYGTDPGNLNLSTTSQSIGNGSSNVPITIDVTGLTTGQDYYAKFRATNPRGTVESSLTTLVPLTLTSMTGWFRADVADFTQSGAQKSFVTWTDLSGSGNHIDNQTSTVNQNPNSINGKPAATFNNSGFWFKPSEVGILNTDIEMYIVFKSSNNSAQDIFNHNNSRRPIVLNSNSGIRVNPSSALGAELTLGASTSYTDGNGYAMHFKTAQNRSQLRINNEPFTHKSGNNRFTQDDDIYMGINLLSPQTDNFYGDIAEILFFNSELSVEQRQEIAQYLSSRYAITVYEPSLPQTASNNLVFSNVGPRNLDVSFTAGDGEQRIIVARESGSQKTPPVIGNAYTANATFGTGSDLGNGNYVVYNGTGNSVAITGLSVSTEYTIDVYEFNVMELDPQYSLTSPNSASTTTQAITPPSIQLIGTNGLNATTATLTYLVNPNSDPTTVNLSYGTSISSLSSSAGAQVVGSQSTEQLISTMLSGLTSGTQYFYKVSATNNGGTTESEIGTFIYQENISLGSLQYWLAGDDPVINTSSGNAVEKWGNRAGKYLPASQVTSNKRPQFISESGLNFLRFDGTDDFMNLPRPDSLGINNSDYEVFIVARSSAQSVGFLIAGASERYEIHTYLGGSVAGTRFIPKSSTYIDNAVNTTNGEFHLINATATATKGRLRVDGNTVVSNGINARSSSTESLLLGQRGGNFLNFDGDIAEVLIYNSELSDAQNLSVSEFLAQKYSITLNSYVAPTQQATAVTFDVFTADQITVSATSGNGSNRLFVVRESSVAAVPPIDGTIYTANTVFGSGSTTGAGNFVVSANSDNSVTVTGLTNNTTYTVDVYEYNVSGNDTRYLGSPATGYVTFYSSAIYSNRIAYVVNSTLDTDTGSVRKGTLRYVLNQINTRAADSTSIVDLRHLRGQITLTDDLPPLNYNTIVVGAGQDSLSISGNNLYRPFFIGAGIAPFTAENPAAPNITMDSFSIVNGRGKGGDGSNGGGGAAGMGGAIFINNGTVEIKNQSFSGNRAIGGNGNASGFAGGGGGFGGNGSGGTPGPSGYLGGFVPTSAGQSGGPGSGGYGSSDNGGNGGFGGGGASVNATSRTTNPGDGGFGGGSGGYGLTYIPGSGIGGFGAGVAAKNGSVAAGGGGAGFGGAIFNRFGNLILSNSHFSTNTATGGVGGSPGVNDGNSYGGAIFNYQGQILTASSTNSSNAADNENDYYNYNVGGSELAVTKLLPPSNITNPSATINATIQTLGYSGSYYVAYGTDPSTLSTSTSTVNYSAGNSVEPISISLTGLNLSSMLYYKLIVTNDLGTFESKVGSIINDNSIPSDSLQLWASADRGLELSENKLENWFDASGKSNSITQSNASAQPALVSNVINGKSVVRFNGTDTFLETPSTTDLGIQNSDYELFVVMQSSSSDLQFLYSGGPEDYEMQLNGSIGLRSIPESGKYLDAGTSAQFTNGQARILTSQITNTSGSVRVNDELLAHVGSSTRNSSSVKLRIGSRYEGSFDFNGDIAEIIIYNKALSTSERTTVMDYLSAKYNVDKVVITEPTVNASQPVVTNRNLTTVAFRVNKGSGANRIVVAREGAAPTQLPSDNQVYTANPTFGSGTEIGTGNYVVYNGSDSTFTVNGLTAGSTYHFAVLEYNGTFETDYLTSSYLSYSVTSLAEIPSVLAGSALRFGGDDETVMVTHTPAFNSAAVTMELWFKSDDSGTDYDFLTSKASEELEIHLGAEGVANTIRFIPASQVYIDSEPGVFTAGEWTHLAVVYDPSISLAKMYVNGEEVSITKKGSNPLTTPRNLSTNNFYLGSREGSALHYNGSLDEVKIWNTVRTVAEIREYMHKPVQTDYQDLIAYWQFNEGTGTALSDNGSALNGTLQNFEFNASNGWENSDVAFGAGTFTSVENVTSGSHALSSLTYALTEDFDNAVTLTSNTITTNPNVVPQNVTLHDTSYWIVKTLGSPGNYQATLTFTVPPTFISKGTAAVTQFNLYHRAENSTGNWSVLKSEASSFSSNSVSFSEIGVSGQFMISREINIDYDEVVGNAIKFDGVNDYISIQDNDILDVSKYTVQLWFNWNEGANNVEFIMAKSIQEFELHTIGSNNSLRFIPAPGVLVDSPPNAFTSNTWTHLTLIFDPSQSMAKMYFNGTEVTPVITGNLSTAIAHSSTPLAFGRRQDNSFYFNGQMDEIRLWNTVRTTAEIQEDMGKTTPDGFNEGLIGYWQFNEGTGTSTVERTFGLNGTLHNFDFNASSGWVESGAPILSAQEVQVTLTGSAGWRLLASPVQNATFETVLSSLWTQGGTGADTTVGTSNVFTWATSSSDNNAASWVPLTDYTRTFEQGEGVLMYVYSDDNGPRTGDSGFPKTLSVTGIALNQDATLTPRLNTNPGGWTLLGNPFSNSFDWDNATKTGLSATVYVWDHNGSEWKYWNGTVGNLPQGIVGSMNAFFVNTMNSSPTLTIPTASIVEGTPAFLGKKAQLPPIVSIQLDVEGKDSIMVYSQIVEQSLMGIDAHDAFWLQPLSATPELAFISPTGDLLSITSLPPSDQTMELPIHVDLADFGQGKLVLNTEELSERWTASLYDRVKNQYFANGEEVIIQPHQNNVVSLYQNDSGRLETTEEEASLSRETSPKKMNKEPSRFNGLPILPNPQKASSTESRFMLLLSPNVASSVIGELPTDFTLEQNYPNPFNPNTIIRFGLPVQSEIRLSVLDLLGRTVAQPVQGVQAAGWHTVTFDASSLSSGIYFYTLEIDGRLHQTKKMTLIK